MEPNPYTEWDIEMIHTKQWRQISKTVRSYLDLAGTPYPIYISEISNELDNPPKLEGADGHYTTPSGKTRIYHPGAYKWKMKYHRSTRKIIVGQKWLEANLGQVFEKSDIPF